MNILSLQNVRKQFNAESLLTDVTFEIQDDHRLGLVGPNGAGKTTLMKIIAGDEDPDAGTCEPAAGIRIGYLEQQPDFAPGRTVWEEAQDALAPLIALQKEALETADRLAETADPLEHDRLAARYDHLQSQLERHDAYHLDHKIERILDGLRFPRSCYQQTVDSLSGGEQNRLLLAKLLLSEPDLMLLDEPSNHLDIEATTWLEGYLSSTTAAVLVVSHDRYFLDKVTNRTLELVHGTVDSYRGNFSAYQRQKKERLLVERRTYEKQQEEIAKAEDFIRRHHCGQKHTQAEDRRKKLERIVPVPPPREIENPPMRFAEADRSGEIVLRGESLSKGFDRPLFENFDFQVTRCQRWGMLGPNGCGKTTLLKVLLGHLASDRGTVRLGEGVKIGYFDQQLAQVDENELAVDAVRPDGRLMEEQKRRDLLARFGIRGDTALRPLKNLSGGERCRVALARLAASDANFLVLDEPTNHLDLWARDALEKALSAFNGTVLFVSHDRFFVNRVADHLLVVEPNRLRMIDGNYDTLLHLVSQSLAQSPDRAATVERSKREKTSKPNATKNNGKSEEKRAQKRRFSFRKTEEIEADIFDRESEIESLHEELAQPETHRDGDRVRRIIEKMEETKVELKLLYDHWEEATELNW